MKLKNTLYLAAVTVFAVAAAMPTAFAATDNPMTGDGQGRYIGVVIAAAAVALVVVVVIAVMSRKNGGK